MGWKSAWREIWSPTEWRRLEEWEDSSWERERLTHHLVSRDSFSFSSPALLVNFLSGKLWLQPFTKLPPYVTRTEGHDSHSIITTTFHISKTHPGICWLVPSYSSGKVIGNLVYIHTNGMITDPQEVPAGQGKGLTRKCVSIGRKASVMKRDLVFSLPASNPLTMRGLEIEWMRAHISLKGLAASLDQSNSKACQFLEMQLQRFYSSLLFSGSRI